MRIVHFLGTMRPGHDGVVRFIYRLREGFKKTGDDYLFISPMLPPEPGEDQLWVPSVPVPVYPDYRIATVTESSIRKLLGDRKPDLVHVHTPCPLGNAGLKYGLSCGVPVIATYHSHFPAYLPFYHLSFTESFVWRYVTSFYNRCATTIITSKAIQDQLEAHGVKNLLKIYPGVDTRDFSPRNRSEDFRKKIGAEGKTVLAYVGRLVWEKNLRLVVDAWKKIKDRSKMRLLVVGDGPMRKQIQKELPDAYFTGFLPENELHSAFASSDIFIFPSMMETFGSVTIEALASGVPAIIARGSAACDFVLNGKNGIIVDPVDPTELVAAIERLVNFPEERQKMSTEAVRSSRSFSWEETLEKYLALYDKFLSPKRRLIRDAKAKTSSPPEINH
jgi:phosphatidylinositol alpha 1,6-mannosyltransferase